MGKGLIANNAAAMFPSPKLITKPITYLKDEEITLLLDTIKTGGGLTKHQQAFSDKQKTRDMAMIYLMPVSYTHLDVYKRQRLLRLRRFKGKKEK